MTLRARHQARAVMQSRALDKFRDLPAPAVAAEPRRVRRAKARAQGLDWREIEEVEARPDLLPQAPSRVAVGLLAMFGAIARTEP